MLILEERINETSVSERTTTTNNNNSNSSSNDTSDDSVLPGFGSASFFKPLPSDGTVVASLCKWQLRYNFVENRIPRRFLHKIQPINK